MTGDVRTNEETLREGYAHFNDGDMEWLLDQVDPEIVWEDAPEIPGAKTYRGEVAVRKFLLSFARLWEEIRFEPEELRVGDDTVVAFCRLRGRGRSSGADVSQRVGHIWEFRSGRVIRVRTFLDWEQAAKAAGITAPHG
jgi:ketosteroid isomerase-like protein